MFIQTKVVQFILTTFSATSKDGFTCYKKVPTIQWGVAPALFSLLARAHMRCKRTRENGKHLGSRSSAVALAIQSLVFSRILTPSMHLCPPHVDADTHSIISPTHFPALIQDSDSCVLVRVSIIKTKNVDPSTALPHRQGLIDTVNNSVQLRDLHKRNSVGTVDADYANNADLESDTIHAALAVLGKPPIRMVVRELLVCVGHRLVVMRSNHLTSHCRYWGATAAKIDGSNKKFIGFVIIVGSSDDGPVPPIRIMYPPLSRRAHLRHLPDPHVQVRERVSFARSRAAHLLLFPHSTCSLALAALERRWLTHFI
jgi:hypothetical protein